jgi:ferredoxin
MVPERLIRVRFIDRDGSAVDAEGAAGTSLLEAGQAAGMPLEGTCEGQMACSTCHVIVSDDWFDRLPEASEEEEDMLDLAAHVTRTSRLSCQIVLGEELKGLEVRVPAESRDMQKY